MPTEKTIKLYTYDELTPSAQETAKHWWLECRDESDLQFVVEDFERICNILGIELDQRPVKLMGGGTRTDPDVSWSLGYSQSDFASFDGRYSYAKGSAKKIREYAPRDAELHSIADGLQEIQSRNFYKLTATVAYHHYYGQQVEVFADDREVSSDAYEAIRELMRSLSRRFYELLRAEDEYQSSDEQIADAMEANGYTFRENGERED